MSDFGFTFINLRELFREAGSGVTSDSFLINEALRMLGGPAGPTGVIYFEPGRYRIEQLVAIPEGVTLKFGKRPGLAVTIARPR